MFFLLISKMLIYILLYLIITIILNVCLATQTLPVEGFDIGADYNPKVFMLPTKPILFLCRWKGFHVNMYLDGILVMTHVRHAS